jgi:UDP-N-acetylglucosamine pyrophosphorylase
MRDERPLAVVIMAAGKGTRMNNPGMAKVMYGVNGKPMVEHVVDLAVAAGASRVIVIVGWQKDAVINHLKATGKPVTCVEQSPQLGTGHAVMQARQALEGYSGDVLVLSGDVPLLTLRTVQRLFEHHRTSGATATVLTAILDDPTGYGRILRNDDGSLRGIMEQKDATEAERAVREINSGIYLFDAGRLFAALRQITPENAQKEYYLTDVFGYFWRNNFRVGAVKAGDAREILGVNTLAQLEEIRVFMGSQEG